MSHTVQRQFFNLNPGRISDLEANNIFTGLDKNILTLKRTLCITIVLNII